MFHSIVIYLSFNFKGGSNKLPSLEYRRRAIRHSGSRLMEIVYCYNARVRRVCKYSVSDYSWATWFFIQSLKTKLF